MINSLVGKNSTSNHWAQNFTYPVSKPLKVSGVNLFHEKPQKCYKYVPTPKTQNPHLTRKFEVTSVWKKRGVLWGHLLQVFGRWKSWRIFERQLRRVHAPQRSRKQQQSQHYHLPGQPKKSPEDGLIFFVRAPQWTKKMCQKDLFSFNFLFCSSSFSSSLLFKISTMEMHIP